MITHRNWLHALVALLVGLTLLVAFAFVFDGEGARAAAEISGYVDESYPLQYADVDSLGDGQAATYDQQSITVWFQHQVSLSQDYTGAEDTFLNGEYEHEWDTYGSQSGMKVNSTGAMRPLIRFDLSTIPYWADVSEARLYLYATSYCERRCDDAFDVTVYKVKEPWEEMEANWYEANSDEVWGSPGADADSAC